MNRLLQLGLLLAALAWCVPAHAACSNTSLGNGITCVQTGANSTQASGGATLAVTLTGVVAGHLLYISGGTGCATGSSSIAGNSNTYTQVGTDFVWVSGSKSFVYYVKSSNSGSTTVTVTFGCTGQFQSLYVSEYSGLDTSTPLDKNNTFSTASAGTTITTASLTTTSANEVLTAFGVEAGVGTGSLTAGTSYTLEGTNANNSQVYEDQGVSSTGSYAGSFGSVSGHAAGIIFATFEASGGAATIFMLGHTIIFFALTGILIGYSYGRMNGLSQINVVRSGRCVVRHLAYPSQPLLATPLIELWKDSEAAFAMAKVRGHSN